MKIDWTVHHDVRSYVGKIAKYPFNDRLHRKNNPNAQTITYLLTGAGNLPNSLTQKQLEQLQETQDASSQIIHFLHQLGLPRIAKRKLGLQLPKITNQTHLKKAG